MTNDWNARPLEEYYTTIPKQKVQFPSVTVCPTGEMQNLMFYLFTLLFY